jgi:hypothetical protein
MDRHPRAMFHSYASDSDDDLLLQARNAPEGDLRAFEELALTAAT